jgi:2Fe-2S ferredoxin
MGGSNPYIKSTPVDQPKNRYSITFHLAGESEPRRIEVDPANMPSSHTGLPGSILDIALALDIDIDHACGGVCACSTCHIVVKSGLNSCNSSTEEEDDQLEKAPGLTPQSRLACQCVPNGTQEIVVQVPNWNRNLVREGNP